MVSGGHRVAIDLVRSALLRANCLTRDLCAGPGFVLFVRSPRSGNSSVICIRSNGASESPTCYGPVFEPVTRLFRKQVTRSACFEEVIILSRELTQAGGEIATKAGFTCY